MTIDEREKLYQGMVITDDMLANRSAAQVAELLEINVDEAAEQAEKLAHALMMVKTCNRNIASLLPEHPPADIAAKIEKTQEFTNWAVNAIKEL